MCPVTPLRCATWVIHTWVALLLRRPFLAIESCFVYLWRNQVEDHFKLKSRDGVFWMEVYRRLSEFAHTQMEKVWLRIILVHKFFLSYSMFACAMYWFFVITFFFNFRIIILVDRKCWLSEYNHLYITQGHIIIYFLYFIGTNSIFACFQMYVKSTFFLFVFFSFFQLSYDFLVHRHVLTQ